MALRVESEVTTQRLHELEPAQPGKRLLARYRTVRQMTERIIEPLSPEDCQVQSMPDASPVKWHLAHTTWFFETFVLVPQVAGYQVFHPSYCYLFNSYYNAVGDRLPRPSRGLITRPALDEVYAYRTAVDQAIGEYLQANGDGLPEDLADVVELGLNHEQQHQELILTDVKHAFAQNPLCPAYREGVATASRVETRTRPLEWLTFPGGLRWLGHDGRGFAFDNEGPRYRAYLEEYQLGSRLVSSGEYLEFIQDGGYSRPELWLSDGWNMATSQKWEAPLYWQRIEGDWWLQTLCGLRPLTEVEPVCHVSFYEADAFARWAGARLPTEAEWESATGSQGIEGNFLEGGHFHPRPAGQGTGLLQSFGDVWEWTRSPYTPYPGFGPTAGALGEYNAKFMCNQLVLRGGSCATPASHIRATYRNFFPPEARWQFTGIRLAKDS